MKIVKANPYDRLLKKLVKEKKKKLCFYWNRGLGDIPLGLYALVVRTRYFIPDCEITFLTRDDLAATFSMLENVNTLIVPALRRGEKVPVEELLKRAGKEVKDFDFILEKIDPTRWFTWQLGALVPKLKWNQSWERSFDLPRSCIGLHVQSETQGFYGYTKDWPLDHFEALIEKSPHETFLLFGFQDEPKLAYPNVIDLRGKTPLLDLLAIIKNHCHTLIAPDSGILNLLYYLDISTPLKVISLWADPRQGLLRQNVPSPNDNLFHFPLIGNEDKVSNISIANVLEVMNNVSDRLSSPTS